MRSIAINDSKVIRAWTHCEFTAWSIYETEDGRFWVDTDPESDGNVSEISQRDAENLRVGDAVTN